MDISSQVEVSCIMSQKQNDDSKDNVNISNNGIMKSDNGVQQAEIAESKIVDLELIENSK